MYSLSKPTEKCPKYLWDRYSIVIPTLYRRKLSLWIGGVTYPGRQTAEMGTYGNFFLSLKFVFYKFYLNKNKKICVLSMIPCCLITIYSHSILHLWGFLWWLYFTKCLYQFTEACRVKIQGSMVLWLSGQGFFFLPNHFLSLQWGMVAEGKTKHKL